MTALLAIAIIVGAAAMAMLTIGVTVLPNLDRIVAALSGQPNAGFMPLAQLAKAERRIAVRRWAAASPAPMRSFRVAA